MFLLQRSRLIGIGLLSMLLSSYMAGQSAVPITAGEATVTDLKGTINVQLPGQAPTHASKGQIVPSGSVIDTNSGRILLHLDDGSQILVREHSRLQIVKPSLLDPTYLNLLLGRIRARISKRTGGAPSFQMGTPSAVISVRGTQFLVEVDRRQTTEVDVLDGTVQVTGTQAGSRAVMLEPGFSTRVGFGTDPESPIPSEDIRPEIEQDEQETDELMSQNKHRSRSEEGETSPSGVPERTDHQEQSGGHETQNPDQSEDPHR
jgi:hypothetical protein